MHAKSKAWQMLRASCVLPDESGPVDTADPDSSDRLVFPATLSASGLTVSYSCPWCRRSHRHRVSGDLIRGKVSSRQTHCQAWRRLHPTEFIDSVRLVLTGVQ